MPKTHAHREPGSCYALCGRYFARAQWHSAMRERDEEVTCIDCRRQLERLRFREECERTFGKEAGSDG